MFPAAPYCLIITWQLISQGGLWIFCQQPSQPLSPDKRKWDPCCIYMNSSLCDFSGDRHQRGLMKAVFWEKCYLKLFAMVIESLTIFFSPLRNQIFGKQGRKDRSSGFILMQWKIRSFLSNILNILNSNVPFPSSVPYRYYFWLAPPHFYLVLQQRSSLNCLTHINWQFSVVRKICLNAVLCLYWDENQEIL